MRQSRSARHIPAAAVEPGASHIEMFVDIIECKLPRQLRLFRMVHSIHIRYQRMAPQLVTQEPFHTIYKAHFTFREKQTKRSRVSRIAARSIKRDIAINVVKLPAFEPFSPRLGARSLAQKLLAGETCQRAFIHQRYECQRRFLGVCLSRVNIPVQQKIPRECHEIAANSLMKLHERLEFANSHKSVFVDSALSIRYVPPRHEQVCRQIKPLVDRRPA